MWPRYKGLYLIFPGAPGFPSSFANTVELLPRMPPFREDKLWFSKKKSHTVTCNLLISLLTGTLVHFSGPFFGPEKPFYKLRSAYSKNLAFYYDVKIRKGKFVENFRT